MMTSKGKQGSQQTTQAHLRRQLFSREAANSRLMVHVRKVEREAARQVAEMKSMRQQMSSDQKALHQAKTTAALLNTKLQKMEKLASRALSAAETWERRYIQAAQDKRKLEEELSLHSRKLQRSCTQRNELLDFISNQEESEEFSVPQRDRHLQVTGAPLARRPSIEGVILDLETELIQAVSEVCVLKKDEQQFQSQLLDVQDKLQQTEISNRGLKTSIQLLSIPYNKIGAKEKKRKIYQKLQAPTTDE